MAFQALSPCSPRSVSRDAQGSQEWLASVICQVGEPGLDGKICRAELDCLLGFSLLAYGRSVAQRWEGTRTTLLVFIWQQNWPLSRNLLMWLGSVMCYDEKGPMICLSEDYLGFHLCLWITSSFQYFLDEPYHSVPRLPKIPWVLGESRLCKPSLLLQPSLPRRDHTVSTPSKDHPFNLVHPAQGPNFTTQMCTPLWIFPGILEAGGWSWVPDTGETRFLAVDGR